MRRHFSQSIGTGAFDGQHGMSCAISSVIADAAISCDMAAIALADDDSAMTGRDSGASARHAIMTIATSRRMVISRSMVLKSHICAEIKSLPGNDAVIKLK